MTKARPVHVLIIVTLLSSSPTVSFAQQAPAEKKDEQPDYSEMMPGEMMGGRHYGMRGDIPRGMMHGHMMKIMFVVADVDGDGALPFEEVTTIHKRIFDKADTDKDSKVTPEEMRGFMRD